VTSNKGAAVAETTILLKVLLKQRHLQGHGAFCREYDRVAAKIEPELKGSWPSKAQFYRWLSGELTGLPYAHHCRILESMFPDWTAEQLFQPYSGSLDFVPQPGTPRVEKLTPQSIPVNTRSGQSMSGNESPEPEETPTAAMSAISPSEIVGTYPYRSRFPSSAWWDLISNATRQIDLLGYTLYFLSLEHPGLVDTLRAKCESGCIVRAAIADPASPHVAYRDKEEGQPITLVVRINSTIKHFTPLLDCENFEIHYQDIPLYNSIFRFDDEMLVTPHLFATPGSSAPLLHLRRLDDNGLFSRFASHFEEVWSTTRPVDWADQ
jgi:hypothetical protein